MLINGISLKLVLTLCRKTMSINWLGGKNLTITGTPGCPQDQAVGQGYFRCTPSRWWNSRHESGQREIHWGSDWSDTEEAAAGSWDHQAAVCRHSEQEIAQTEAGSLILPTFFWHVCVRGTYSAPYKVSIKGGEEGGEKEEKSHWKDPEVRWERHLCFREQQR